MRTFILILNLCMFCLAIPFQIVSFNCDANPEACMNNICRVRILRSKATVVDYMCYHPYPLNSIELYLAMKRRNSKAILFEMHEDVCKAFKTARMSLLFIRVVEILKENGLPAAGCPISENVTITGLSVVSSLQFIAPLLLRTGVYEILAIATDGIKQILIVNASVIFSVK